MKAALKTLLMMAASLAVPVASAAQAPYDVVIRNARIVDGTGAPWYRADLAIRGDSIAEIAPAITSAAARVIDVKGAVVAPGFIDLHTHAARGIFEVPTADNYVRQGVTTMWGSPTDAMPRIDVIPDPSAKQCRRDPESILTLSACPDSIGGAFYCAV